MGEKRKVAIKLARPVAAETAAKTTIRSHEFCIARLLFMCHDDYLLATHMVNVFVISIAKRKKKKKN